ncbi:uncharacterized protein [Miscanthus floridulus]|uniref:uncharacterized protein n=1 Tax=Miscanthus floridulus TaxID=154761 RepID=UPI003457C53F
MAGGSGEAAMSPPSSGGGKRGRDPEEDVYVDNLHSHKRYLSEAGHRECAEKECGFRVVPWPIHPIQPLPVSNRLCCSASQSGLHDLVVNSSNWMVPRADLTVCAPALYNRCCFFLQFLGKPSLNGLSVGDSLPDNIMESPARSETASCFRDEILSQYSPMSEDSDYYRCYDTQLNPSGNHPDAMISPSISPMSSPH